MARRRRGRDAVTSVNANFEQELLRPVELPSDPLSSLDMFIGETLPHDRRLFSFGEVEKYSLGISPSREGSSPVRAETRARGSVARFRAIEPGPLGRAQIGFNDPNTVAICLRRKVRKEVMIARRGRGSKRPRRKWYSNIRC